MEPLISFIIPIYNVSLYLDRCIESVINQTYKNLEIILVDDGSTDNSGEICDKWGKKDERIVIIHKINGGLADARNAGIDIAKGELIAFLDSDDTVHKDYIMYMYKMLKGSNSDIACCDVCIVDEEGKKLQKKKTKEELIVFNKQQAMENMLYDKYLTNSANFKLYKRELFQNVRYPKGKIFEDLFTTYKLIYISDRVVYGSKKLYYYLLRNDSILGSGISEKKRNDLLNASQNLVRFVDENMPEITLAADYRMAMSAITIIGNMPEQEVKCNKVFINKLWEEIRKKRIYFVLNKKVSNKFKILFLISFFGRRALFNFYQRFVN